MNDIHQLLVRFGQAIVHSTPHLYCSTMTWIPQNTELAAIADTYFPNRIHISDGQDKIWPSQQALWTARMDETVTSVAYSPDGKHIVSGSTDKTLRVWDAHRGILIAFYARVIVLNE